MRWLAVVLLVTMLASMTFGVASPSWVDPSKVVGTLIFAHEFRLADGYVVCWGTAVDPEGDPLEITMVNPPADTILTVDPNGAWQWTWKPTAIGVYYLTVMAEELPSPYPGRHLNTLVTTALRVLPANQPPVVTPGGCRTVSGQ